MMEVEGQKIKDLVTQFNRSFLFLSLSFRLFTEETARSEIEKGHFLRSLRRNASEELFLKIPSNLLLEE